METAALAAARELSPLIESLRDATDAARNIAPPIVARLRDDRLCRLALAKELAGAELPIHEALDVYETLAYADASVAWVAWNNSRPCFFGRILASDARSAVFENPRWLYACSTRPSGRAAAAADGYRVNGRWGIVSGCELAEWIMLLCVIEENGAPRMIAPDTPELRFAFLRRDDCEILDTWKTCGMRGTGSQDVVAKNVRVPQEFTLSIDRKSVG